MLEIAAAIVLGFMAFAAAGVALSYFIGFLETVGKRRSASSVAERREQEPVSFAPAPIAR
jgi:hypothetical protein